MRSYEIIAHCHCGAPVYQCGEAPPVADCWCPQPWDQPASDLWEDKGQPGDEERRTYRQWTVDDCRLRLMASDVAPLALQQE